MFSARRSLAPTDCRQSSCQAFMCEGDETAGACKDEQKRTSPLCCPSPRAVQALVECHTERNQDARFASCAPSISVKRVEADSEAD